MRFDPPRCNSAVLARSPDVESDDDDDEGQDIHFQLEIVERYTLPNSVPFCIGDLADGRGLKWRWGGSTGGGREARWSGVGRTREVGKVYQ